MSKKEDDVGTEEVDTPSFMTEDKTIELVNRAISTHMNRFSKSLDNKLGELVNNFKPSVEKEAAPESSKEAAPKDETSAQIADLKKQMENAKKLLEEERNQRAQAVAQSKRAEEIQTLTTLLTKNGVSEKLLDGAVAKLYHAESRVKRDDSGRIVFRTNGDFGEEDMPIEDGISTWIAKEGKPYIKPARARGAGGTASAAPKAPSSNKKPSEMTAHEKGVAIQKVLNVMSNNSLGGDE